MEVWGSMEPWAHFLASLLVCLEVLFTGLVVFTSDDWKGTKQGINLDPTRRAISETLSKILLTLSLANICVIVWQLVFSPADLNSKDEIGLTAIGLGVLWWTDIFCVRFRIRRRRDLADLVAVIPTIRFGKAGGDSPTKKHMKDRELVIRTAHPELHEKENKQKYFRGAVAGVFDHDSAFHRSGAKGISLVLLHEYAAQDEAGADLLDPNFTHKPELKRQEICNVVFKALVRSRIWNLQEWDGCADFVDQMVTKLVEIYALERFRKNENWQNITEDSSMVGYLNSMYGEYSEYFVLINYLWAAICTEIFEFLGPDNEDNDTRTNNLFNNYNHNDELYILKALVDLPLRAKRLKGRYLITEVLNSINYFCNNPDKENRKRTKHYNPAEAKSKAYNEVQQFVLWKTKIDYDGLYALIKAKTD